MRAAVIDIGTNSTRLLIADVTPEGEITELVRRSTVTRLGAGVDKSGALSEDACARVCAALASYRAEIDVHADAEAKPSPRAASHGSTGAEPGTGASPDGNASAGAPYPNLAVLTSAARDATNGPAFAERVRLEYDLDARVLSGEEEARLTFLGAMSGRTRGGSPSSPDAPRGGSPSAPGATDTHSEPDEPTVVIDVGGGSTEFIVGAGHAIGFHTSLPAGVVRMSERHIGSDPPAPAELQQLTADTRTIFREGLPRAERDAVVKGIAVAGTATSAAAIEQELEPYDPARVHGYPLMLATVEMLFARIADMTEAERRAIVGLDPARAPTIVAGLALLSEAMRAFDLDEVEVSEHDILHGGVLALAGLD